MTVESAKRTLQFIDLHAQQERIRADLDRRIAAVLQHGKFIMGPEVAELEAHLAAYVGVRYCVTCASGTDALLMPLMAYNVGPGDAVLTTPFTFIATAEVISLLGATPVFVDIDPLSYNIDPQKLTETLAGGELQKRGLKPKGIIPVDLFGQPADYLEIERVAKEHGLFVLEDAAQSFGAQYRGRKAGSFGAAAGTSFFPAKPLGCYGDGGAVFTDDDHLAEVLRSIRVHGKGGHKYDNVRLGINGRFDTLQAAVLLAKLKIFDEEISLRNAVARRYSEALAGRYVIPQVKNDRSSVWAQYSIQTENREACLARLKAAAIPTAIYYPRPLHLQGAFAALGYQAGDFPVAEEVAARIFSLPMHPYLSEEDQQVIVGELLAAVE